MLEPRDRTLLLDALRPPAGFEFDEGIGTSYTLDLLAMLMAPMAFTLFAQPEGDQKAAAQSLEILESLRRYADQLTLFCHAGRITSPNVSYPQLIFLENSIIECQPQGGYAFHPKVWVLRWHNAQGEVRYRMLCLSRNLTFSRAWDSMLALDGVYIRNRKSVVGRNRGLVDFVRALPRFVTRQPLADAIAKRVERLASELERTEFDVPDHFEELRFWPLGVGGRAADPLPEVGSRLLVVSPFLTLGRLESLADSCDEMTLVSTLPALSALTRKPEAIKRFYNLVDQAVLEGNPEGEESGAASEALELSDLHAKLYVTEFGSKAHIWTGSANATTAAFGGNVEFMVELVGPKRLFGIDTLMQPQKGEVRFVNLLEDAAGAVAKQPPDPAVEALERELELLREHIASVALLAHVAEVACDAYDVAVDVRGAQRLQVPDGVTLRCWPITLPASAAQRVSTAEPGAIIATFPRCSFPALTSFFSFQLIGRAAGEERQITFTVNLPMLGAPEGRRERVLKEVLNDRAKVIRFLFLLLADEGLEMPTWNTTATASDAEGPSAVSRLLEGGLFELLLRNLDRSPERLDHLDALLKELRSGSEQADLLPEQFDAVWQPIWHRRQAIRARRTA